MASVPEFSLLALRVYSTPLATNPEKPNAELNRPAIPAGWTELEWHADELDGFSYGIYGNGSEIVVAYAGTNQGIDWVANGTNGIGMGSTQLIKAAIAYLQAKQDYGENISFTGHSLGGGLASIMAVWFDRPATVFDEAPFEATALNRQLMGSMIVSLKLGGYSAPELTTFFNSYTITYAAREANVVNYYLEGEILAALRFALPTVMGQDYKVSANIEGNSGISWSIDLHSQVLLATTILSESFRKATYVSPSVPPILMDERFYAYPTDSPKNENILIKLIRSEQGDGKALTHLASDLQKIGSNNQNLSKAAQNALIAQSMEWYYWQSSDYAGKEFFTATDGLLQYTTAQGDNLPGAKNKAIRYVNKWLTPLYNNSGDFGGRGKFDQWNMVVNDLGQSATALDENKTQIFIGSSGDDNFTGGKADDVMLSDAGADTLDGNEGNDDLYGGEGNDILIGGKGSDQLQGGKGNDTYRFTLGDGVDVIRDEDGQGSIEVDGQTLTGGKKRADGTWISDDKQYLFTLVENSAGGNDLVISRRGQRDGVRVQGWQAGQLGITLDDTPADDDGADFQVTGDQAPFVDGNGHYQYDSYGNVVTTGDAQPGFADVIFGSGGNDKLSGGAGADTLVGQGGADALYGGDGDDKLWGDNSDLKDTPPEYAGQDYLDGGGVSVHAGNAASCQPSANDARWVMAA